MAEDIGAIILAAGTGTRMQSSLHKVLHPVGGRPMVKYLLDTLDTMGVAKRTVVVGARKVQLRNALPDEDMAEQKEQLGTGHAVYAARRSFEDFTGDILILYGDVPMVTAETLEKLLAARRSAAPGGGGYGMAVLGFRPRDPAQYGRLQIGERGELEAIIEFKDASVEDLAIELCNSGIMAVESGHLFELLESVDNSNAKGEYYLTDIVDIGRKHGIMTAVCETHEEEVLGINSREDLAYAEAIFQHRRRLAAIRSGVTLLDPQTVYFSHDTVIERDVYIEPGVFFGAGVTVREKARIKAFSHLEECEIGAGASIGPFARLRPGAKVGESAKIGNFVEVKKSEIGAGAKVSHLAYIGDAVIGREANIGAGTITCNYDGFDKHLTEIGEGAFIGSNSSLIAPVRIGAGAMVGAGSAVSGEIPDDALALVRAKQTVKPGWARDFRDKKSGRAESETGNKQGDTD